MRNRIYILFTFALVALSSCANNHQSLGVLQLNAWHEGKSVPNGFEGIIDVIDQMDPEVVLLQEIRSQKTIDRIIDSLQKKEKINNQTIAIYSIHLDWLHAGYYLARDIVGRLGISLNLEFWMQIVF